jgi:hypothetical protein
MPNAALVTAAGECWRNVPCGRLTEAPSGAMTSATGIRNSVVMPSRSA